MDRLEYVLEVFSNDSRYQMVKELKSDIYGSVELVHDLEEDKLCVRKCYYENWRTYENEFKILSTINHRFIPKVYESYMINDHFVMIEEYIEGKTLTTYIEETGKMGVIPALRTIYSLCSVVKFLHNQSEAIIHRDIKPDNIIYKGNDDISLIDFGIARKFKKEAEKDTVFFGTQGYAPPEQFGYGQTDNRADIFAIGKTLAFMLHGRQVGSTNGVLDLDEYIPSEVRRIINKAAEFNPADRYSTISQLMEEIKRYLDKVQPPPVKANSKKVNVVGDTTVKKSKSRFGPVIALVLGIWMFAVLIVSRITDLPDWPVTTQDKVIVFVQDIVWYGLFVFIIVVMYTNLFNFNKWNRLIVKYGWKGKIITYVISFFLCAIIIVTLNSFTTQEYKQYVELRNSTQK